MYDQTTRLSVEFFHILHVVQKSVDMVEFSGVGSLTH